MATIPRMRLWLSLGLFGLFGCTTVIVNVVPDGSSLPDVDVIDSGANDSGMSSDTGSSMDGAGDVQISDSGKEAEASTICTRDPNDDGICLGQTGNYYAWTCPTAKTDLPNPACADGGFCMCVNMGIDGGTHYKCCNISQ